MQIQKLAYFLSTYGYKRGLTVMHRMRTWYNHQARVYQRAGFDAMATKYHGMADAMTSNIEEWPR